MKPLNTLAFGLLFIGTQTLGQEVVNTPEFKTGRSSGSSMEKKLKKAPKKILLNSFRVSYQILYTDWEATRAGVNIGETSAQLTVGFEGMEEADFQKLTDEAYNSFVSMMTDNGYEILNSSVLEGDKSTKKLSPYIGGEANYGYMDGYITTFPTGFNYYSNDKNKLPLAGYMRKLDAIVIDVNLKIPFMSDSESGASKLASKAVGGISKVVASPALRIEDGYTIDYQYPQAASVLRHPLKNSVGISGVFEQEKFKATSTAQTNTSYNIGHITRVYSTDVNTAKIQVAKGDPEKYKKGVSDAMNLLITTSWKDFQSYTE